MLDASCKIQEIQVIGDLLSVKKDTGCMLQDTRYRTFTFRILDCGFLIEKEKKDAGYTGYMMQDFQGREHRVFKKTLCSMQIRTGDQLSVKN